MITVPRVAFALLVWVQLTACAANRPADPPALPPTATDFLVASRVVGDLERGPVTRIPSTDIRAFTSDYAKRWAACGAVALASAEYRSAADPGAIVVGTAIQFGDSWGAYCGFTPGRTPTARPVAELEGAFEERLLARAWRSTFVVEVRTLSPDMSRDHLRGLLRAMATRLPGPTPPQIPGSGLLPEATLVPGSEAVVPSEVLATVMRPALVADVRCGVRPAKVFVVEFPTPAAALAALDTYQGSALELFMEVSPYARSGAEGIAVKSETGLNVVYATGNHLLGLLSVADPAGCDEALAEVAARAAPVGAADSAATQP